MKKYYTRFRYIPPLLSFTPLMYIPIDHVQVEASDMATEQELAEAISACFEGFVQPEYIRFESIEKL